VSAGTRLAGALPGNARSRVRTADRIGDGVLYGLCLGAALLALLALALIVYKVADGASLSISRFGVGFLTHATWEPNFGKFSADVLIYGTVVTAAVAMVLGIPLAISIALYLSMVAPRRVSAIIGPLVEMLAAIPSVILGFWGILVLAPFLQAHLEPFLHSVLGFLPIFGPTPTTGTGLFIAGLILTIMVVPIVASLSRDLFLTVPRELQEGASALGATRWEVIRGVILPSSASGVAAASCLGLGRALGEAIAVTQVIGAANAIHGNLFETGDTLASRIADQFPGAITSLHTASLFYLGLILLAFELVVNLAAQWIARRFDVSRGASR
jgi:phosphate transport system permease protein